MSYPLRFQMNKDYYYILDIPKKASHQQIKKAYKAMALKYHPDKNEDPNSEASFKEIGEAYSVLSDPGKRAIYDRLPIAGLYGHREQKVVPRVDPIVQYDLKITLEEIISGCVKKMKITRKVFGADHKFRIEEELLEVNVPAKCKIGEEIKFPQKGDRRPGRIPSDILVIIVDKPHPVFQRVGVDIKYVHKMTSWDVQMGLPFNVPLLDGGFEKIITGGVYFGIPQRLFGKGLPISSMFDWRGDLVIEFEVDNVLVTQTHSCPNDAPMNLHRSTNYLRQNNFGSWTSSLWY